MGNTHTIKKINFEDMQIAIKTPEVYLIINTLPTTEQSCLIHNTINISQEESIINKYIKENTAIQLVIYGKHCNDETTHKKYQQLVTIGFTNVCIYTGGMFEWLLLQNIFDENLFPTSKKEFDILAYKPPSTFTIPLLHNS